MSGFVALGIFLTVCFGLVIIVSILSAIIDTGLIKYDDLDEKGYYEKMNENNKID